MVINQRYEILRPLRQEPHGEIFLARDQVLEVDVSLKYLANDHPDFERLLEYYRREAYWGLKIHHPQILGVHHLDEGSEGVFLLLEPFAGRPLAELLHQGEPLTTRDALYFMEVLAQGLAYGHKHGISHQNFTPRQILVSATEGIKICNFAFPAEPADLAATPALKAYLPPEVWHGRPLTPAGNLFSLAVVGFQMITGTLPFTLEGEGLPPYQLDAVPRQLEHLPEGLRPLFNRCLKAEPEKRFKSAQEFLTRLAVLRTKFTPEGGWSEAPTADLPSQPVAPKDHSPGQLKILPLEPEVEINPDWQEAPPRTPSSWSAANNWVMTQRQHVLDYFGPEPLRHNRRKQTAAAVGGGAAVLVLLWGLSSLFGPSPQPKAVVLTADQPVKELSSGAPQTSTPEKPALLSAPPGPAKPDSPEAGPVPPAKAAPETVAPEPVLPEPARAVKPAVPAASAVKAEKPPVKPEKPPLKPVARPEGASPKPTPATAAAAKPAPAVPAPKLVATFAKESAARQKADALIKQGQKAVVKKAKKGNQDVYQVWLAANKTKPKAGAKTTSSR